MEQNKTRSCTAGRWSFRAVPFAVVGALRRPSTVTFSPDPARSLWRQTALSVLPGRGRSSCSPGIVHSAHQSAQPLHQCHAQQAGDEPCCLKFPERGPSPLIKCAGPVFGHTDHDNSEHNRSDRSRDHGSLPTPEQRRGDSAKSELQWVDCRGSDRNEEELHCISLLRIGGSVSCASRGCRGPRWKGTGLSGRNLTLAAGGAARSQSHSGPSWCRRGVSRTGGKRSFADAGGTCEVAPILGVCGTAM